MRKILLIDDDPFIANFVSMRILNRHSGQLEFVRWPPESLADKNHQDALKDFDTIFVDYTYPESSGFKNGDEVVDFLLLAQVPENKILFFTNAEIAKHKEIKKLYKNSPKEFCDMICGRLEEESKA